MLQNSIAVVDRKLWPVVVLSPCIQVLKAEYYVLTELKRAKAKHFCDILDSGLVGENKYVVMTLVGPTLTVTSIHLLHEFHAVKKFGKIEENRNLNVSERTNLGSEETRSDTKNTEIHNGLCTFSRHKVFGSNWRTSQRWVSYWCLENFETFKGLDVWRKKNCKIHHQIIFALRYLHRDIKPGNFAIGRKKLRQIYLLDFGMCRKYLNNQSYVRNPRKSAGFRGTIRYCKNHFCISSRC